MKKKHEGNQKQRLAAEAAKVPTQMAALKNGTRQAEIQQKNHASEFTVHRVGQNLTYRYHDKVIRKMDSFKRNLKSNDPSKIRLLVATHLFGRYKVTEFMKECWYVKYEQPGFGRNYGQRQFAVDGQNLTAEFKADNSIENGFQRDWFITVAFGGSLYKEHCKLWLRMFVLKCIAAMCHN